MTLVIVTIILLSYILIATEKFTNISKAAVAIFVGTLVWILYVGYGMDFVTSHHSSEYANFLALRPSSSVEVKNFIAQNIFLRYVGKASEVVLFLLSTMAITEILVNNGCFDFLTRLIRTRHSKRMLWIVSALTFVISANLDNLTTTVIMLTVMHGVVVKQKQRILMGCAIAISANCGGALTVIGDPTGLVLWNTGAVTATNYSMTLAVPCLVAWALPVWWIGRMLPPHVEVENMMLTYRGDDANVKTWQRILMLMIGIGGLWFIPTFHNITKLSPFVGALCVVAVLCVVNEIITRKSLNPEEKVKRRGLRALQYDVMQMILFVLGIMLTVGVVCETGIADSIEGWLKDYCSDALVLGLIAQAASSMLDNFVTSVSVLSVSAPTLLGDGADMASKADLGLCWKAIAFSSSVGGNILCIGSMSGLALMKIERIKLGWYLRNVGWVAMIGSVFGLLIMNFLLQ